jgi:hypothetical protein
MLRLIADREEFNVGERRKSPCFQGQRRIGLLTYEGESDFVSIGSSRFSLKKILALSRDQQ